MTSKITELNFYRNDITLTASMSDTMALYAIMHHRPDLKESLHAKIEAAIREVLREQDNSWGVPMTTYFPPNMVAVLQKRSLAKGTPINNELIDSLRLGMSLCEDMIPHQSADSEDPVCNLISLREIPATQPMSTPTAAQPVATPAPQPEVKATAKPPEPMILGDLDYAEEVAKNVGKQELRDVKEAIDEAGAKLRYIPTEGGGSLVWRKPGEDMSEGYPVQIAMTAFDDDLRLYISRSTTMFVSDDITSRAGTSESGFSDGYTAACITNVAMEVVMEKMRSSMGIDRITAFSNGLTARMSDSRTYGIVMHHDVAYIPVIFNANEGDFVKTHANHWLPPSVVIELCMQFPTMLPRILVQVMDSHTGGFNEQTMYKQNHALMRSSLPTQSVVDEVEPEVEEHELVVVSSEGKRTLSWVISGTVNGTPGVTVRRVKVNPVLSKDVDGIDYSCSTDDWKDWKITTKDPKVIDGTIDPLRIMTEKVAIHYATYLGLINPSKHVEKIYEELKAMNAIISSGDSLIYVVSLIIRNPETQLDWQEGSDLAKGRKWVKRPTLSWSDQSTAD